MKGLVVYHTKYGNGKLIAEAIAKGLEEAGHDVMIGSVDEQTASGDFDFVVLGSPTRAGRMTGAVKRFISRDLKKDSWKGKQFVAVGTGFKAKRDGTKFDGYGARSAEKVYEALENAGLKPATEAQKFFVEDMRGPLVEGEEDRALEFGRSLGKKLAE